MTKRMIDVNTEEEDVVAERVSYSNLSVQDMLDKKMQRRYGKDAKEEYVDDILRIIDQYRTRDDLNKTEADMYKRALQQIDGIYWIQKNKEPLKVFTRAWTMQDIQNRLK